MLINFAIITFAIVREINYENDLHKKEAVTQVVPDDFSDYFANLLTVSLTFFGIITTFTLFYIFYNKCISEKDKEQEPNSDGDDSDH